MEQRRRMLRSRAFGQNIHEIVTQLQIVVNGAEKRVLNPEPLRRFFLLGSWVGMRIVGSSSFCSLERKAQSHSSLKRQHKRWCQVMQPASRVRIVQNVELRLGLGSEVDCNLHMRVSSAQTKFSFQLARWALHLCSCQ